MDGPKTITPARTLEESFIVKLQGKTILVTGAGSGILPEIEIIDIKDVNKAWETLQSKQMSKRFVIDMKKSFPSA